jgi:hypothetical protein
MRRPRNVLLALLLALPALGGIVGGFILLQGTEEEVKAAFLHKFTHFVEWPETAFAGPKTPLVVGVLGADPFGKALDDTFAGKQVNGRGYQIVRGAKPDDLKHCHLVYVASSEKPAVLKEFDGSKALVVGDADGFAKLGVSLNFVLKDRRVRLQANPKAAARAGLKISSKLLQVCDIVPDEPEKP